MKIDNLAYWTKRGLAFAGICAGLSAMPPTAMADTVEATVLCLAGHPWLSFSTGVPRGSQPSMVWVGAVNTSNQSEAYSLQGSMWRIEAGLQAAWRVYPNGPSPDSVLAPAIYPGFGTAGAPLPTYAELLKYSYVVGYGILPSAAEATVAANAAAYQKMREIPARRASGPALPSAAKMGPDNVDLLQKAHDETVQARMSAIGTRFATAPASVKPHFAQQLSDSMEALEHPHDVRQPTPVADDAIRESYIRQDMLDNKRSISVHIGEMTDSNKKCVRPTETAR